MKTRRILDEVYNELMEELGGTPEVSPEDIRLGNFTTRLAQFKGELATILDRAQREGWISRDKNNKLVIHNKVKYQALLGDLPAKIKQLQQELLPK